MFPRTTPVLDLLNQRHVALAQPQCTDSSSPTSFCPTAWAIPAAVASIRPSTLGSSVRNWVSLRPLSRRFLRFRLLVERNCGTLLIRLSVERNCGTHLIKLPLSDKNSHWISLDKPRRWTRWDRLRRCHPCALLETYLRFRRSTPWVNRRTLHSDAIWIT